MKRILSISLIVVLIGALTATVLAKWDREEVPPPEATKTNKYEKQNLTSQEAFALAYEEAKKVTDEEPLLIHLGSTDDTDRTGLWISNGADGRRNAWNFSFGSAEGNLALGGSIRNGECTIIQLVHDDNNSLRKGKYHIADIKIDSSEAIRQAVEVLDLRPGNPLVKDDWIKGYHFTIADVYPEPYSTRTLPVLRVIGISPNSPNSDGYSLRMQVYFDAKTGEMLHAAEQTGYDEEGHSLWRDIVPEKNKNPYSKI